MSSLRAPVFENSNFVAEIYFIFLKTCPRSNFKCYKTIGDIKYAINSIATFTMKTLV